MKKITLSFVVACAVFFLASCNKDDAKNPDPNYVAVDSVVVTPASLELPFNSKAMVKAKVYPEHATKQDADIVWSSTDAGIASIDKRLVSSGNAEGETYIVAKVDGKEGKCHVQVKNIDVPVIQVILDPSGFQLFIGEKQQVFSEVRPANASNLKLTWISTQPNIASVDENGMVTAKSRGVTTIKATAASGKFGLCSVQIE